MLHLNPSPERTSARHCQSLWRICQPVAQGCGDQEQGCTCPSVGLGAGAEEELGRGWQWGRGRAGVQLLHGTTLAQHALGNEMRREERGWLYPWAFVFMH